MTDRDREVLEWAHFDPATLSCQFSGEFLKATSERSIAAFLSGTPREVLIHEAAHLLQVAGTAAGVRLWSITQNMMYLSMAAAERVAANTRGVLPLGVFYLPLEIMHGPDPDIPIAMRTASIFRYEFFGGLTRVIPVKRLEDLERDGAIAPYIIPGYAQSERKWPRGEGIRDHKLEMLLPIDDDDTSACVISLGAIHLIEGQSAVLEDIDLRQRMIVEGAPPHAIAEAIIELWRKKPEDPYRICHELWVRMLYGEAWASADPWELVLVIDLAFMLDGGTWKAGKFNFDYSLPFDNFVTILEKMRSDDSLRYGGLAQEDEVDFQNRVLSSIGINFTMLELTKRIPGYVEAAMEVTSEAPLAHLNDFAKRAFSRCAQIRLDARGTSPTTQLAFASTPEIIEFLS